MKSRMDKYNDTEELNMSRSEKNQQLYKQVYNAYDSFENLVVPSNAREIDIKDLKKEIDEKEEYHRVREYDEISQSNNKILRKEMVQEQQRQENEIYDIKELLNKAVSSKKEDVKDESLLEGDYLKKLNLNSDKTNIEQVKEMYDDIMNDDSFEEDPSLLKTANLSLEILSDLKGDDESTMVGPPIKDEELPKDMEEEDFYSNNYKFSKKDFEDKDLKKNIVSKEKEEVKEDEEEFEIKSGNGKFFFKILLLIFGISLVVAIVVYLFNYFNRV